MINCIIFSKNRAAQLHLLLQSIEKYAPNLYSHIIIICQFTTTEHREAYRLSIRGLTKIFPQLKMQVNFEHDVKHYLSQDYPLTTFLVDDDVFFRPVKITPQEIHEIIYHTSRVFSLRLGKQYKYLKEFFLYRNYMTIPRNENVKCAAYPLSLDGNMFDTKFITKLIDRITFINPNKLESRLQKFTSKCSNIYSTPDQCLVGIPINRVSSTSHCSYGEKYALHEDEICNRFLQGDKFNLDQIDFSNVNDTHVELKLQMS